MRLRLGRHAAGFTLVELMVCVAIFAVIALAVQEVFNMTVKMWRTGDARLKMFQNARFALEVMGVHARSAMRPDNVDIDRDGLINSDDTGVAGARFIVVNQANQTAAQPINANSDGIGEGFAQTDAMGFHSYGYTTDYENSDWACYGFGCRNDFSSATGIPVIYQAKINNKTDYDNGPGNATLSFNTLSRKVWGGIGASVGTPAPEYYHVNDFQLEAFNGSTASGSGSLFWDSADPARGGRLPTMLKIWIEMQDEKGIAPPEWIGTCIPLTPGTGTY